MNLPTCNQKSYVAQIARQVRREAVDVASGLNFDQVAATISI